MKSAEDTRPHGSSRYRVQHKDVKRPGYFAQRDALTISATQRNSCDAQEAQA